MTTFTEQEIQQLLLAIFDVAVGRRQATGKRQTNPTPFLLPNGRKIDIDTAIPIADGIGLSVRDHADPNNAAEIALRIGFGATQEDLLVAGSQLGILEGTTAMPSCRILKQSESLPAPD